MWPNVSRNRAARLRVDLGIGQKHEVADERPSPTEKAAPLRFMALLYGDRVLATRTMTAQETNWCIPHWLFIRKWSFLLVFQVQAV